MILLTRLNGGEFALNPDLIERADATPDTVLTLTDGTKYIVSESLREIACRVRDFRASVLARAHSYEEIGAYDVQVDPEGSDHLHSASGHDNGSDADDNVRVLRPLRGM